MASGNSSKTNPTEESAPGAPQSNQKNSDEAGGSKGGPSPSAEHSTGGQDGHARGSSSNAGGDEVSHKTDGENVGIWRKFVLPVIASGLIVAIAGGAYLAYGKRNKGRKQEQLKDM
ncbi:hypothetical protein KP509_37G025100 [Ceratopteris richardii]|uniref:Uncharacterized protein n=1 Tax=Ceratopteris richardii TaxID=49495 RepID=A0A8T2Q782_CERRI|nr:hypothetical protein KP509_37G025100 [Ceratopteris richardii]